MPASRLPVCAIADPRGDSRTRMDDLAGARGLHHRIRQGAAIHANQQRLEGLDAVHDNLPLLVRQQFDRNAPGGELNISLARFIGLTDTIAIHIAKHRGEQLAVGRKPI